MQKHHLKSPIVALPLDRGSGLKLAFLRPTRSRVCCVILLSGFLRIPKGNLSHFCVRLGGFRLPGYIYRAIGAERMEEVSNLKRKARKQSETIDSREQPVMESKLLLLRLSVTS